LPRSASRLIPDPFSSVDVGQEGRRILTAIEDLDAARRLLHQGWEEVAAAYVADPLGLFEGSAGRLLSLLQPPSGAVLLDIGTGGGAVALQASSWVGPEGRVVGSDIAMSMLRHAKRTRAAPGSVVAGFCQMDAECLGFADDSFDVVACAFSLFQFPDMRRALVEMARVARPGGRVGLSNWGPGYFTPIAEMQRALFHEFGLRPILANSITFRPDELRGLLEAAGLTQVQLEAEEVDECFKDPQAVWDYNMSMGPFPMMVRGQLPEAERRRLHERFLEMIGSIASQEGIRCTFHVLYALARQ
jgi:ubiquinone/menaquinone biosynthesis C-methylase UbiE